MNEELKSALRRIGELEEQRDRLMSSLERKHKLMDDDAESIDQLRAELAALHERVPVKLQHMVVVEGGNLRWMTGRFVTDCELYAMPDLGRAPELYAAPVVSDKYTYSSKQETECAGCGVRKHTPLRVDEMGGYVCLTCIDAKLTEFYDTPVVSAERQGVADGWHELAKRADDFLYSLPETDTVLRLRADLCTMLAAAAPAPSTTEGKQPLVECDNCPRSGGCVNTCMRSITEGQGDE